LITKGVELKANLILTPELAISGYEFHEVLGKEWIKTRSHTIIGKFSSLARELHVALVPGSPILCL
jgi:predicted amidohydrolase